MSANSGFGTWGRYKEIPLDKMTPDQKRIYQLTVKERGQVPGPYKICLQKSLRPRSFLFIQGGYRDCHKPDKRSVVGGLLDCTSLGRATNTIGEDLEDFMPPKQGQLALTSSSGFSCGRRSS
jgi:hypothetical protein